MTTNKNFDQRNNISKDIARQIQTTFLTLPQDAILNIFQEFCNKEKHMGLVANYIVDSYAKLVINNTLINESPIDQEESFLLMDPVDEALSVAHAYKSISNIMRNVFLIGLNSGKALTDKQFSSKFDINNVLNETNDNLSTTDIKEMSNINKQKILDTSSFLRELFKNLGIDITQENKLEDDKEKE